MRVTTCPAARAIISTPQGGRDLEEVQEHPYFGGLSWDDVLSKRVAPEFKPTVTDETDTSNFDHLYTRDKQLESICLPGKDDLSGGGGGGGAEVEANVFDGFTYTESGTMMDGAAAMADDGLDTPR
jgi:hypothetical protein